MLTYLSSGRQNKYSKFQCMSLDNLPLESCIPGRQVYSIRAWPIALRFLPLHPKKDHKGKQ
uniref:Uncharacterized protein n=1 Tax=Rhizophora mucronata TaxID=61149 RepID=A0A2P2JEP0_RHIMU